MGFKVVSIEGMIVGFKVGGNVALHILLLIIIIIVIANIIIINE